MHNVETMPALAMSPEPVRPEVGSLLTRVAALVYDTGWMASYGPLADRYGVYRSLKSAGNKVFGRPEPFASLPDWSRVEAVIDGFRHSGNSFVTGNLLKHRRGAIASRLHRPWVLSGAVARGLPVVLLIRDPLEVALSRRHRTIQPEGATYGLPSSIFASLACWYLYHGHAWRLRRHLTVLPFPLLASDYAGARRLVEAALGPTLAEDPSYDQQNRFDGPRPKQDLSHLDRAMLWLCRRRYARFLGEVG